MRSKSRGFAQGHLQRDLSEHAADKCPSDSSGSRRRRDRSSLPGGAVGSTGGGIDKERRDDELSQRLGQHTSQKTAGFAGRGNAQVQLFREEMFHSGFLTVNLESRL